MSTEDTKIALVTGGGSGIGLSAAKALEAIGFKVILAGRNQAKLEQAVSLFAPGQAVARELDVTRPQSVAALFEDIQETFGRLDLLFNNAGNNVKDVPIDELPVEDWLSVINTNLTGAFLCTQAAVKLMKRQSPQGGRIINNGSISAQSPRPNSAPYTASKHAITGLTKSTALDGRAFNIACGQIDIGNAATDMGNKALAGRMQADGHIAEEPVIPVERVGEAVAFMAGLPLDTNVLTMTVMASAMPLVGRG
ncbi:SDR family oxidoreductase [Rahnella sp. C60]|jgi:NAD(P)-dependent dehydrogenase (short-subunit alcohol dehydrogenase family)|uniref:SDR family oxidoreductase n=1 Tax=Rahnella perminowiae TaxID=2816244 RepID=A0ABS6L5I2_9GAMM|nr:MULTISPECIES: SDR family oxidoreductase [Rahnella]UJD88525.1 SDR family oxidoreductase [Rahnella aquatilis]MBU9812155.1 SDR family oxidoreductase [Rahnella perminowiae]MBU9814028.1 SDR family oxidoreductase [Rahnella perminowiae]MBU9827416.1 SDR family oxidoreductase [Rahnella perminowiae]MBU9836988.1 SDR family oxidoreductase [Rahnella perminowiae]